LLIFYFERELWHSQLIDGNYVKMGGISGHTLNNPLQRDNPLQAQKRKAQEPPSSEPRKEPKILDPRKVKWMAAYQNTQDEDEEDETGFITTKSGSTSSVQNLLKKEVSEDIILQGTFCACLCDVSGLIEFWMDRRTPY
jgi:hypothetical protein